MRVVASDAIRRTIEELTVSFDFRFPVVVVSFGTRWRASHLL